MHFLSQAHDCIVTPATKYTYPITAMHSIHQLYQETKSRKDVCSRSMADKRDVSNTIWEDHFPVEILPLKLAIIKNSFSVDTCVDREPRSRFPSLPHSSFFFTRLSCFPHLSASPHTLSSLLYSPTPSIIIIMSIATFFASPLYVATPWKLPSQGETHVPQVQQLTFSCLLGFHEAARHQSCHILHEQSAALPPSSIYSWSFFQLSKY